MELFIIQQEKPMWSNRIEKLAKFSLAAMVVAAVVLFGWAWRDSELGSAGSFPAQSLRIGFHTISFL